MIFLMQNPNVSVLVPQIDGHEYQIDGRAAVAGAFTLSGVIGAGDAAKIQYDVPKGADAFRLSASQLHLNLDLSKQAFFTFQLPAPNRVVALSAREDDIVDAFGNRRTAMMPTSYAFVYQVANSAALALSPNPGWNVKNDVVQSRFANLVVRGELAGNHMDPVGEHARAAFREMTSFFPNLEMQFFNSGPETHVATVDGMPEQLRQKQLSRQRGLRSGVVPVASTSDCRLGGITVTTP